MHREATDELLSGLLTSSDYANFKAQGLVIEDAHLLSEQVILELTSHFENMTEVGLKQASLTPYAFTQLFGSLAKNKGLTSLNLYGCQIVGDPAKIDLTQIHLGFEKIISLNISAKDKLGTWLPDVAMEMIVDHLVVCPNFPKLEGLKDRQIEFIKTQRTKKQGKK